MSNNSSSLEKGIEKILTPEKTGGKPERQTAEQPAGFEQVELPEEKKGEAAQPQPKSLSVPSVPLPPIAKTGAPLKDIERVLSEDLEEIYFQLPPDKQQEFKKRGEETARRIKELLEQTKVKVKKIAHLIWDWLKMIPGVNKFFLEKESKIKTDEVLKLKVKS